ncbi:MAG: hypothetical protein ACLFPF_10425 [Halanaerobiales bacterium]
MRKGRFLLLGLLILGFFLSSIFAMAGEDFPDEEVFLEDQLFSEDMFVNEENIVNDDAANELNKQGIGISGELSSLIDYNNSDLQNSWLQLGETDDEFYTSYLATNILVDARFRNRIKGFLNYELMYEYNDRDNDGDFDSNIKELFLDVPYNDRIYVKAGKQVLRWGRSYFWNPTDLINIKKKDISDPGKSRDGIEGIKVHVPYGVKQNIYLFFDTDDVKEVEDIAVSGKYELLVGNTEMSFSAWLKSDMEAVYGFDISGRANDIDLRAELSLSRGDNNLLMDYDTFEFYKEDDRWIQRISAGFTKYFDHADISDRISISGEVYYNSNGYDENIYRRIEGIEDAAARQGIKMRYLGDVYQPNMNSKYYIAFFTQVNEFLDSDIALNLNGIINLIDHSKTLSAGIDYQANSDWTYNLNIRKSIGDKYTEAVLFGQDLNISLGSNYNF